MISRQLLTTLLAAPLLLALQPRADNVHFAPEVGSSLTKEFGIQFDLSIGDLSIMVSGMDVSESVPADFEVSTEMNMTVVDQYVEVTGGKPLELVRLYDSIEATWETPDDSGDAEDADEMVGKSVRFKWNPESEEYEVTWHESEGDDENLESLGIDLDLLSMLPDGEVSEGDSWTLEGQQVAAMIIFGTKLGDMDFELEDDEMGLGPLLESELKPQLEALLEGLTAECTYTGRQEVDGVSVGAIEIEIESEGSLDLSGLIAGLIESQVPDGIEIEVAIDEAIVSLALEGQGTLLWNLEAGRLHQFNLEPELEILVDVVMAVDAAGESQDIEASVELLGNGEWTARAAQ